jgi:hypothetical protein
LKEEDNGDVVVAVVVGDVVVGVVRLLQDFQLKSGDGVDSSYSYYIVVVVDKDDGVAVEVENIQYEQ